MNAHWKTTRMKENKDFLKHLDERMHFVHFVCKSLCENCAILLPKKRKN